MGTTCQNSTQIHLQRETAAVMLGSTSICMYHLETEHLLLFVSNRNVSIDVSFYHMDFPTLLRAEHQHYYWALHFGKGQLVDCLAKQLLVSFSNKTC